MYGRLVVGKCQLFIWRIWQIGCRQMPVIYMEDLCVYSALATSCVITVFKSMAPSKLLYASSAWRSFSNSSEIQQIESVLKKSKRAGFCPEDCQLCDETDDRLFLQATQRADHVLRRFLSPIAPSAGPKRQLAWKKWTSFSPFCIKMLINCFTFLPNNVALLN